jgi:hypothetical protein
MESFGGHGESVKREARFMPVPLPKEVRREGTTSHGSCDWSSPPSFCESSLVVFLGTYGVVP